MGLWPSIARKKMVIFMLWRLFLPWLHVSGELKKVNCKCKMLFSSFKSHFKGQYLLALLPCSDLAKAFDQKAWLASLNFTIS